MIVLKKDPEVASMRRAGAVLARALREMSESIVPNKTTPIELDALAARIIADAGGIASFHQYRGYPASTCISVNEVVVHGIPDARPLQDGDIVGLDLGVCIDGFHADGAWTYPVGPISDRAQKLLNVTRESLFQGIAKAKPGNAIGDISATIQRYCESQGFGVVRDLVGHGIGRNLHEEPSVPNFGKPGKGPILRSGMTMCIEPMIAMGTWRVKTLPDEWTIVTADGKLCAHFEHTVVITPSGAEILTQE